jgi:hypothetical protein
VETTEETGLWGFHKTIQSLIRSAAIVDKVVKVNKVRTKKLIY